MAADEMDEEDDFAPALVVSEGFTQPDFTMIVRLFLNGGHVMTATVPKATLDDLAQNLLFGNDPVFDEKVMRGIRKESIVAFEVVTWNRGSWEVNRRVNAE